MVKIKVSYGSPEQLQKLVRLLGAAVVSCKPVKEQKGAHLRAYIMLRI